MQIKRLGRPPKIRQTEDTIQSSVHVENPSVEFLREILSGGPVRRHLVYREAENANLMWEDIRNAFLELNGREYIDRGETLWRL